MKNLATLIVLSTFCFSCESFPEKVERNKKYFITAAIEKSRPYDSTNLDNNSPGNTTYEKLRNFEIDTTDIIYKYLPLISSKTG